MHIRHRKVGVPLHNLSRDLNEIVLEFGNIPTPNDFLHNNLITKRLDISDMIFSINLKKLKENILKWCGFREELLGEITQKVLDFAEPGQLISHSHGCDRFIT